MHYPPEPPQPMHGPPEPLLPTHRYAFTVYVETAGANETLQKLNQAELPDFPGRKVTIVRSELNNKLFIGNFPREVRINMDLELKSPPPVLYPSSYHFVVYPSSYGHTISLSTPPHTISWFHLNR